ncbi:hypothetical protein [Candidatus Tisiphia endosymbiont of Hybos culiciformis]|uniref:hypothetical protein n=1 Tax=Candidatus Tisiphia endosymbiont of Hybos culiciformis TaxID=3139331 RepID=UPI003CCB4373
MRFTIVFGGNFDIRFKGGINPKVQDAPSLQGVTISSDEATQKIRHGKANILDCFVDFYGLLAMT